MASEARQDHPVLWSAAWGVVTVIAGGAASTIWLAAVQPGTTIPVWPAYVLAAMAVGGLYGVFAPVFHWPPFRRPAPDVITMNQMAADSLRADISRLARPPMSAQERADALSLRSAHPVTVATATEKSFREEIRDVFELEAIRSHTVVLCGDRTVTLGEVIPSLVDTLALPTRELKVRQALDAAFPRSDDWLDYALDEDRRHAGFTRRTLTALKRQNLITVDRRRQSITGQGLQIYVDSPRTIQRETFIDEYCWNARGQAIANQLASEAGSTP